MQYNLSKSFLSLLLSSVLFADDRMLSIIELKQNARSLLKHVSDTAFYVLSHGCLGLALHGSFFNRSFLDDFLSFSTETRNIKEY